MNKKDLKFYEAPLCDVIEVEVEAELLAGSPNTDPFDGSTGDTEISE